MIMAKRGSPALKRQSLSRFERKSKSPELKAQGHDDTKSLQSCRSSETLGPTESDIESIERESSVDEEDEDIESARSINENSKESQEQIGLKRVGYAKNANIRLEQQLIKYQSIRENVATNESWMEDSASKSGTGHK